MRDVFAAVLLMSAAGTLMYLLALLLRPLTAKRFDARWHYRVCALVCSSCSCPSALSADGFTAAR
jgi:beta-lactamase regulating signal transducer with metallopeptidase domain